jgi:hypothetical protein
MAGAFVDLTGRRRVLGVSASVEMARPLSGAVPFTEQVTFGGDHPLIGFTTDRLVGESGVAAALRYEWPVWVWLSGTAGVEVGNVFGRDLDGFAVDRLRLSMSVGLRSLGGDHRFQLLVGAGTEPFVDGTRIETVRIAIGGTHGF